MPAYLTFGKLTTFRKLGAQDDIPVFPYTVHYAGWGNFRKKNFPTPHSEPLLQRKIPEIMTGLDALQCLVDQSDQVIDIVFMRHFHGGVHIT